VTTGWSRQAPIRAAFTTHQTQGAARARAQSITAAGKAGSDVGGKKAQRWTSVSRRQRFWRLFRRTLEPALQEFIPFWRTSIAASLSVRPFEIVLMSSIALKVMREWQELSFQFAVWAQKLKTHWKNGNNFDVED
jgi:hypothetical protein